jgi:hypothetical protein
VPCSYDQTVAAYPDEEGDAEGLEGEDKDATTVRKVPDER